MPSTKPYLLVVEDEPAILAGLLDVLRAQGYEAEGVENGEEGMERGRDAVVDLVLLDVMLPGVSGLQVCQTLREERPSLPILMLTARGAENDILDGFQHGADDYVTKPFSLAELLARIEALLRRRRSHGEMPMTSFQIGPFLIDPDQLLASGDGEEIELTRREVDMLFLFFRESGRIVSRKILLQEVWGLERADRVETRTVDMHIAKLRKKLGPSRNLIETVRGRGYRLLSEL